MVEGLLLEAVLSQVKSRKFFSYLRGHMKVGDTSILELRMPFWCSNLQPPHGTCRSVVVLEGLEMC